MLRLFLILLVFTNSIFSQEKPISAKIKIIDKSTNSPKANATIVIKESGGYFITNANGEVDFQVPANGYYTLRIISGTDVEVKRKEIYYDGQELFFFVGEKEKGAIEVAGEKEKTKLSRYTLQQEEIKRLPGAQGDSLKAILTLPGVSPAIPIGLSTTAALIPTINGSPYSNSDRGDVVLRGAGARANQFYFDGFPVSYPFHLGNQSSVFNNNIIKSFDIYTGAYSTRYGYATGGIINIEGKSDVKKTSAIINMNFFLSDALIETKLSKKSYMIAAARKNYPNLLLLRFYPDAIPPNAKYADYQDYQFKYGHDFSDKHKITFSLFGVRDRQAYTNAQAEFESAGSGGGGSDNRPPIGLDKSFYTEGFRYIYQPTSKFSNTLSISRNTFKEFFEVKITNPATAENIFGIQNVTTQTLYYVENIQSLELIKNILKFETGQNYRERNITLKGENITQQNNQFTKVFNDLLDSSPTFRALIDGDGAKAKEYGAYGEATLDYAGFKLVPGLRWDYYNLANQKALSPRVNTSYTIKKTGTTFIAGAGIHRNSPVGIEQVSSKVGNSKLLMEKAEHMALGVNQEIGQQWLFKVEGFRN
ncbi:MAG TPA: TonB-dependent receptor, partial [Leptospiraceae bacterium]|nr:TonB-dependent receptor [Leptospiraceae bacterium]